MLEVIKQNGLQLDLGNYGNCKFSHTFPVQKQFRYNPWKLPSQHMFMMCM